MLVRDGVFIIFNEISHLFHLFLDLMRTLWGGGGGFGHPDDTPGGTGIGRQKKARRQRVRPRGRAPKGKMWDYTKGVWTSIKKGRHKRPMGSVSDDVQGRMGTVAVKKAKRPRVRPRGRAPKGKMWDHTKGTWTSIKKGRHKRVMRCVSDDVQGRIGTVTTKKAKRPRVRPRGRAPKGKMWDHTKGVWVDGV